MATRNTQRPHDWSSAFDLGADKNAVKEGRLLEAEIFWRDHYLWLKELGYRLRPRYHPEWKASWTGSQKSHLFCEDGRIADVRRNEIMSMLNHISDKRPLLLSGDLCRTGRHTNLRWETGRAQENQHCHSPG